MSGSVTVGVLPSAICLALLYVTRALSVHFTLCQLLPIAYYNARFAICTLVHVT